MPLILLRVTSDEWPMTSKIDSRARDVRQNLPQNGEAETKGRFEIKKLGESKIEVENVKTQRSERSRQLSENKDKSFFLKFESRQDIENKGLNLLKAVNVLKRSIVMPL